MEAAARKMVQPSPLPQGWGWRLTPSWEDGRRLPLWSRGHREVARELRSRPISRYDSGADLGCPAQGQAPSHAQEPQGRAFQDRGGGDSQEMAWSPGSE